MELCQNFKKQYRGHRHIVACGCLVIVVICAVLSGCNPPHRVAHFDASVLPFSITNLVTDNGSSSWIVQETNGLSFVMGQSNITIYFQIDNTLTIWFDPKTKRAIKILLETPSSDGKPGQWVTDFNADGEPDMRRIKGISGNQVFYQGQWYSSEPGNGTNLFVSIAGKKIALFWDGREWSEVK